MASTSTAHPTMVRRLRQDLGVSRPVFARLTGYSERSIAAWEGGRPLSDQSLQRMTEIQRLRKALAEVMRPETIGEWLDKPNATFSGLKPLEVVERGQIDRLWRMIFYLESGIAS